MSNRQKGNGTIERSKAMRRKTNNSGGPSDPQTSSVHLTENVAGESQKRTPNAATTMLI